LAADSVDGVWREKSQWTLDAEVRRRIPVLSPLHAHARIKFAMVADGPALDRNNQAARRLDTLNGEEKRKLTNENGFWQDPSG
jgi:hypothetical protein